MIRTVSGRRVIMTRGDTTRLKVVVEYGADGVEYDFLEGDTLRFTLKKYLYDREPLLVKDIPVSTQILELSSEDTKDLVFGEYHYNIELITAEGDIHTVIPDSIFVLTPEV